MAALFKLTDGSLFNSRNHVTISKAEVPLRKKVMRKKKINCTLRSNQKSPIKIENFKKRYICILILCHQI